MLLKKEEITKTKAPYHAAIGEKQTPMQPKNFAKKTAPKTRIKSSQNPAKRGIRVLPSA